MPVFPSTLSVMYTKLLMSMDFCSFTREPEPSSVLTEDFQGALVSFQCSHLETDTHHRVTVRRSHVWGDSHRLFKRGISINKRFDVTFLGEPAVDAGGPRREYFTLLLKSAANQNALFEGPIDHRIPDHNMSALMEKEYVMMGRMFVACFAGRPCTYIFG